MNIILLNSLGRKFIRCWQLFQILNLTYFHFQLAVVCVCLTSVLEEASGVQSQIHPAAVLLKAAWPHFWVSHKNIIGCYCSQRLTVKLLSGDLYRQLSYVTQNNLQHLARSTFSTFPEKMKIQQQK